MRLVWYNLYKRVYFFVFLPLVQRAAELTKSRYFFKPKTGYLGRARKKVKNMYSFAKTGRPPIRADESKEFVGMSFRVSPKLKNLLLEISKGYDISMTELLLMMALREAGVESLDDLD